MNLRLLICLLAVQPASLWADSVVPTRTIRAQTILSANDLAVIKDDRPSVLGTIEDIVGLETRVVLYEGRPINHNHVGPAAIIERNQIVKLVFHTDGLVIAAEGRSLGRAGIGENVKVMNVASRTIVLGRVSNNGEIVVSIAEF